MENNIENARKKLIDNRFSNYESDRVYECTTVQLAILMVNYASAVKPDRDQLIKFAWEAWVAALRERTGYGNFNTTILSLTMVKQKELFEKWWKEYLQSSQEPKEKPE